MLHIINIVTLQMSWGATSFTPIVTRNQPPFGFHEVITPPDFKVCNQNPWGTAERMKREIQDALKLQEYRKKLNITNRKDFDMGYDLDYDQAQTLRCIRSAGCGSGNPSPLTPIDFTNVVNFEQFASGNILGFSFGQTFSVVLTIVVLFYFFYRN